jgi:hypothetical protein
VLRDAHREGRSQARVGFRHQATLGEVGGQRGCPHRLRHADPRVGDRRMRELPIDAPLAERLRAGHEGGGALQVRPGALWLPCGAPSVGGAHPCVDGSGGLTNPVRDPERIAVCGVDQPVLHHAGNRLESLDVGERARSGFVGVRQTGVVAEDLFHQERCRPHCLGLDRTRLIEVTERRLHVARRHRQAGAVDEQQCAPGRICRKPRPLCEGRLPHRRVAHATRQDLDKEPCRRTLAFRGALGGIAFDGRTRRVLGLSHVARDVGFVPGLHHQRPDALVRRCGRAKERVDELSQVLQAAASLEQPHQPLERLAERGGGVVGGKVVAGGAWLVSRSFFEVCHVGEEPGLPQRVGRQGQLGAKASQCAHAPFALAGVNVRGTGSVRGAGGRRRLR